MNTRRSFAFGFATLLLSGSLAASAEARSQRARRSRRTAHAAGANMPYSREEMGGGRRGRGGATSSDNVADQLNAQSLARATGQTQ